MKASRFTDAQKAFIIRQGEEGTPVAEICRKVGISQATYFNWKKKYAGMMPSEMKRLRELDDENGRLKRIVADLSLDKEMLQDIARDKGTSPSNTRCPQSYRDRSNLRGRAPMWQQHTSPSVLRYVSGLLKAQHEAITKEPLPKRWIELIQYLNEKEERDALREPEKKDRSN